MCRELTITYIFLKESSDARMEPPIHVEYLRSGGAEILYNQSTDVAQVKEHIPNLRNTRS